MADIIIAIIFVAVFLIILIFGYILFGSKYKKSILSLIEQESQIRDDIEIVKNDYNDLCNQTDKLIDDYNIKYEDLMTQLQKEQQNLDNLRKTHRAVVKAEQREQEIQNQINFYCIELTDDEIKDITILEELKPRLSQPRILSMLIWQTYVQKKLNKICANVLGGDTVIGVYKITNQKTKESYIGQSVDIKKRWCEHAKCGLGIDTPPQNKLYEAIKKYGIQNFSWELLEKCSKEELNEKERYYINLYDSVNYGYNSNIGVK